MIYPRDLNQICVYFKGIVPLIRKSYDIFTILGPEIVPGWYPNPPGPVEIYF
jgi:hypothetical protein